MAVYSSVSDADTSMWLHERGQVIYWLRFLQISNLTLPATTYLTLCKQALHPLRYLTHRLLHRDAQYGCHISPTDRIFNVYTFPNLLNVNLILCLKIFKKWRTKLNITDVETTDKSSHSSQSSSGISFFESVQNSPKWIFKI